MFCVSRRLNMQKNIVQDSEWKKVRDTHEIDNFLFSILTMHMSKKANKDKAKAKRYKCNESNTQRP